MIKKIKQRDITDCGASCLASIAAYYKLYLPVSRIRQYAGTDKKGTNLLGLIEAAEKLGFQAKGVKGDIDGIVKVPLPAIAHIILKNGVHHYVVIYKADAKRIVYMDPGDGQVHKKNIVAFRQVWSGVLLLILPNNTFTKGKQRIDSSKRFWQLIKPHSSIMLQALVGAIIYTILGLSTSIYVQKIIDFVLVEGNSKLLNLMSIVMIVLLFFQLAIGGFKALIGLRTGQHIDAALILGYYKHLLQLPQRFFDTMRVGEIISRVNDAVKIRVFINEIVLNTLVNVMIIGFAIAVMFLYYWKLALIMLVILPFYLLIYWINNRINKRGQRALMERSASTEAQLVESLNAVGTIKKLGLEKYANEKTENRFYNLLQTIYTTGKYGIYISTASEMTTRIFTIIILWSGSYFVLARELSPGELLSFYTLIGYFTGPAASLINTNKNIQDALIATDRLFEIIDLETENNEQNKVELSSYIMEDIHFNNVHFRYGTRQNVFEGLNLTIKKGEATAIIGESGSGKSTILHLLQNLYPLKEGNITIGNLDIRYCSHRSIRKVIGIVPQRIDLFAGSVIENIAIGDEQPNMQKVLTLCQMLGISEFIERMPNSYHTILSEHGNDLSGGQRQRLAIARALYRDPEILILDEATANLDPASEQKIQEVLKKYNAQGKTIIIITHRLSTIQFCKTINVLQNGKLIEQGTHEELVNLGGLYTTMYNAN